MNELEKEAALGKMLAKGTLHLGKGIATKVAPAIGKGIVNTGKFAIKNPGKALGGALTGSVLIGTGSEAMKAAKKEIEEPIRDPRDPFETDKIAAYNDKNQKQIKTYMNTPDENNFKYMPHIVGGVALGLGVAHAIKSGNPMAPINAVKGAGDTVFKKIVKNNLKKSSGGRVISGAINSADVFAKAKNKEVINKYINIKPYPKLDPNDVQEKVIGRYMVNDILPDDIADSFNSFLNQVGNGSDITRPELRNKAWSVFKDGGYLGGDNQKNKDLIDSFIDYVNDIKYTDRTKLKDDQYKDLLSDAKNFFKENPNLKDTEVPKSIKDRFRKFKNVGGGLDNINKGLGAGVAIGAGDFLFHAIGDKYFDEKDNNQVKRVLRESYEKAVPEFLNPKQGNTNKEKYKTPQERADRIIKRAGIEDIAGETAKKSRGLLKEILVEDALKTMKRSAVFAAMPIAAGRLMGRDLKSYNFARTRNEPTEGDVIPSSSNKIILEMPLNNKGKIDFKQISKVAAIDKGRIKQLVKDDAIDTLRQSVRALSFIVPPAAVYALTGRNLKGNLEKINQPNHIELAPLEPGKARIIIEQNNDVKYDHSFHNGYYGMGGKM